MSRSAMTAKRRSKKTLFLANKKQLCLTAAAALTTTSLGNGPLCAHAFAVQPKFRTSTIATISSSSSSSPRTMTSLERALVNQQPLTGRSCLRSSRLYSSKKDDDNGFLAKVGNAVKSILPSSWFQSEEEKKAAIQRQRVRDEVSGGITELLKDAPLPIRMFGKMMSPLMSNVMSNLAETMAEQQETMDSIMSDARKFILNDDAVVKLLGEPISIAAPFSQSSSTTSINGQSQTRIELAFEVSGTRGSGVARLSATNAGVQQILLQAMGRTIPVNLSSRFSRSSGPAKFSSGRGSRIGEEDDNIIEAEIIEKDTKYEK